MNILTVRFEQMSLRDKVITLTLLGVMIILGFLQLVHKPRIQTLENTNQQLHQKRLALQVMQAELQGQPDPGLYSIELQNWEKTVTTLLPTTDEMNKFISVLNKTAIEQQVTIVAIKQGTFVDKKSHYEIPLEIAVSCSYKDLLLFINKLEHLERFNTISKVTVQPEGNGLNAQLITSVYVFGSMPQAAKSKN